MIERLAPGVSPETVRLLTLLSDEELLRYLDHADELAEVRDWGFEPPTREQLEVFLAFKGTLQRDLQQLQQEREHVNGQRQQIAIVQQERTSLTAQLEWVRQRNQELTTRLAQVQDELEEQQHRHQDELDQLRREMNGRVVRDRERLRNALDYELTRAYTEAVARLLRQRSEGGDAAPAATVADWASVGLAIALADACGITVENLARDANLWEVFTATEQELQRQLRTIGYRLAVTTAANGRRGR